MTLTDDQQFTIGHSASVAIDAGAGSGKTFVLTRRLLQLIQNGLAPEDLVAVTFTEAAAAELRSRLQTLLDAEAARTGDPHLTDAARRLPLAQISTIHALCARIARDHPVESGAGLRFEVLDEAQAAVWLDSLLPGLLGSLPVEAFGDLPVGTALDAVRQMLRDPYRTEAALRVSLATSAQDLAALEERAAHQAVLAEQRWQAALDTLAAHASPDAGDALEQARRAALLASAVSGHWKTRYAAMHSALQGVRRNAGTAKAWGGTKGIVGSAVEALKSLSAPESALDAEGWQVRATPVLERLYTHVQTQLDQLKAQQEKLTFADLERLAARALSFPEVRAYYHERWRAICVDEFQDTSPLQWQILSALAPENVNFTVVGDEKQSIYAFRGADVRLFRQARALIAERGGASAALQQSFRTHEGLVNVTNHFFSSFMPGPTGPDSTAATFTPLSAFRLNAPHPSPPCELHVIQGPVNTPALRAAEADLLAHRLQALMNEGRTVEEHGTLRPLRYSDMALLLRVRTHLPVYEGALFRAGIPYTVQGGRGLLDRPEVRDLAHLLLFLAQPADDLALAAVLRSPLFGWTDAALLALTQQRDRSATLWAALQQSSAAPALLGELIKLRGSFTASALISSALERTEHRAVMASLADGERRLANIDAFVRLLHTWAGQGQADIQSAAAALEDTLRLDLPVAEAALGSTDTLQIMTIHGSKGLEFPVVVIPDLLQQGRADTTSLLMDAEAGLALRVPGVPGEEQPERYQQLQALFKERRGAEAERLMYVALTRAADTLILTATAKPAQALDLTRLTSTFPEYNVARFAYAHHKIPRPEPHTLHRTGRVHGARSVQGQALPETLPVTSLVVYLTCPRAFEYRYLTGRPPFTPLWQVSAAPRTGGTSGALIGSAVHQAIELGWNAARIDVGFPHLSLQGRAEVKNLVQSLNTPAFAALPTTQPEREVPLSVPFEGLTFEGVIDAHYGHWIVDYKTDGQVHPEDHAPQLALYLQATGAQRASLAYLRHGLLHTLSSEELEQGLKRAQTAATGIQRREFSATPSLETCRFCLYQGVCDQAVSTPGKRVHF